MLISGAILVVGLVDQREGLTDDGNRIKVKQPGF